jgi:hypothetical protein
MIHDTYITLFLDVTGTDRISIELNKLFVTKANNFTLIVHYALNVDCRRQITTRFKEDLLDALQSLPGTAISDMLDQGSY